LRNRFSFALVAGLILSAAGSASAHYTFIMPEKFRVTAGESVTIGFHSADAFPESSSIAKRLKDASLHSARGSVGLGLHEDGKRMAGVITVPASGHVIATVVNDSAVESMKAESFTKYLKEEGLTHIVDSRTERGETDKAARERYTMFAKTIFLSDSPDEGYKYVVGLPIEIVPEKDPYLLKPGEALPVRVLFRDAAARNLEVMAASAGATKSSSIGKTDSNGKISIPVTSGKWRLHTIAMERSSNPDADWESFWATLTFEVQ
jgi:uncharacterized GH25 family protein